MDKEVYYSVSIIDINILNSQELERIVEMHFASAQDIDQQACGYLSLARFSLKCDGNELANARSRVLFFANDLRNLLIEAQAMECEIFASKRVETGRAFDEFYVKFEAHNPYITEYKRRR